MTEKGETSNKSAETRVYETGYLLIPNLSSEEVTDSVNKIRDTIESAGGVFLSSENPKLMKLAYAMEKTKEHKKHIYEEAYFGWIKFEASADALLGIKNTLDGESNIVRFLIAKTIIEDTRVPKRPAVSRKPKPADTARAGEKISEAEIDKAIDELVA